MELTVQNVYGLLLRSKLLPLDTAREMYQRWQTEAKDQAGNLAQFCRWLVAQQYLTEYQVSLLSRGHAEGFFLGQYKVLDRVGRGRMAGVYKAAHETGQTVAIKVLPPSRSKDPSLLARFQREARLARKLKHPNIVRAFQVSESGGVHYLVMEYLEGETLEDVLHRRSRLPVGEAVRLVHQALLGLEHIHEQGLVHRDLKPANLMLVPAPGPDGSTLACTVKILDMGLGRTMFQEGASGETEDAQLTTEGVLLGTPDYMAPEQARSARTSDIRADVYSLGCVLYHLLTGQPPFPDTNLMSQMIRHATEPPRPLSDFRRDVPDGLEQIISWMLAKDPVNRYPTPERAAQALQVFLSAGHEESANPQAEARLRSYLTWLDTEDGGGAEAAAGGTSPAAAPPSAARTGAASAPAASAPELAATVDIPSLSSTPLGGHTAPSRPASERRRARDESARRKVKKGSDVRPPAVSEPPSPTQVPLAAPPLVDVELVPEPAARAAPSDDDTGFQLTIRDLILLAIGGGAVPAAIFLGWLLANWSGLALTGEQFVWFAWGSGATLLLLAGAAGCWLKLGRYIRPLLERGRGLLARRRVSPEPSEPANEEPAQ